MLDIESSQEWSKKMNFVLSSNRNINYIYNEFVNMYNVMFNVYSMQSNKTDQHKNKPLWNNELKFLWQCDKRAEYM